MEDVLGTLGVKDSLTQDGMIPEKVTIVALCCPSKGSVVVMVIHVLRRDIGDGTLLPCPLKSRIVGVEETFFQVLALRKVLSLGSNIFNNCMCNF